MEQRTFDEWSNDGYHIIKGSKSIGRNSLGQALFDSSQVKKLTIRTKKATHPTGVPVREPPKPMPTAQYRKLC